MSLPSPSIASSDATLIAPSSAFSGGQATVNAGDSINVQVYVPEYNVQVRGLWMLGMGMAKTKATRGVLPKRAAR